MQATEVQADIKTMTPTECQPLPGCGMLCALCKRREVVGSCEDTICTSEKPVEFVRFTPQGEYLELGIFAILGREYLECCTGFTGFWGEAVNL